MLVSNPGSGLLHTMGWTTLHESFSYKKPGQRVCEELLIPMRNIFYVQKHENDTCMIALTEEGALHCDIPFKQMKQILKEWLADPSKSFDTHPDLSDDDADKPKKAR